MSDDAAHIFVVDDDERLAALLCRFLISQGYMAISAQDAADARRKLEDAQAEAMKNATGGLGGMLPGFKLPF